MRSSTYPYIAHFKAVQSQKKDLKQFCSDMSVNVNRFESLPFVL
jgi:hypothetical protein